MATVALAERYLDTLQAFGEVDILVNQAVEKYLIDRIVRRIKKARSQVANYERIYDNQTYATFSQKVQLDEDYYNQVRQDNPLWEQDMLVWEYWDQEAHEWTERLNNILNAS
jgi:hypothetical protein